MAVHGRQAVSRWPLIVAARVRFQATPTDICDVRSGIGAGFPPSTLVLSSKYHSTSAPYSSSPAVYMLLLPEARMGEPWGPPPSDVISDVEEHWTWYSLLLFRTSGNTGHGTFTCYFGHRGTLDMVLSLVISDIEELWTSYSLLLFWTSRNAGHGTLSCYFGHRGTLDIVLSLVNSDIEEHWTWYSLLLFRTSRNAGHGTPTLFRLQRVNTNSKIK